MRLSRTIPKPRSARLSLGSIDGESYLVVSFPIDAPALPPTLTDAETGVAWLLLAGATNEDIAYARQRSVQTVAKQVAAVFRKLGVGSRAELAAKLARP